MNACELTGKKIQDIKIVVIGAGAAAISRARLYRHIGVKNILMIDSKGVIYDERDDLNKYKKNSHFLKSILFQNHLINALLLKSHLQLQQIKVEVLV